MNALEIIAMAVIFAIFAFAAAGAFIYAPPKRPSLDALYVYWPANYQALDRGRLEAFAPYSALLTCHLVDLSAWSARRISAGGAYGVSWWVAGSRYAVYCR